MLYYAAGLDLSCKNSGEIVLTNDGSVARGEFYCAHNEAVEFLFPAESVESEFQAARKCMQIHTKDTYTHSHTLHTHACAYTHTLMIAHLHIHVYTCFKLASHR